MSAKGIQKKSANQRQSTEGMLQGKFEHAACGKIH